jgi:hypothetical protein
VECEAISRKLHISGGSYRRIDFPAALVFRFVRRHSKTQCMTIGAVLYTACRWSRIFCYKKQLYNYVCFMGKVL